MCYHPNVIILDRDKWNPNTGKNWQQVGFYSPWNKDFKGYEFWDDFNKDTSRNCDGRYKSVRAPCGNKCLQCCESKAKEWATKIMLESMQHEENYMITFTYDEKYLPRKDYIICEDGEIFYDDGTWNSYLDYEHARNVIRKIRDWQRKEYGIQNIKIFGCGEYGGKGGRAHFHIIFMGLHIEPGDVKIHQVDQEGNIIYECKKIQDCWIPPKSIRGKAEPMGFVSVAECNWQTARYVAGYVQKKNIHYNKKDEYEFYCHKEKYYARRGQTEEKCFMSTHPGIGKSYYEKESIKFFEDGYIMIRGAKNKIVPAAIPRYFVRMLENDCEPMYERYKAERQEAAEKAEAVKMSQTSLTIKEQLEVEERNKKSQMLIFNLRDKVG